MYEKRLIELALKAREKAYCPYSNFAVGAALLCQDGTIYTGCNIESSAYTPTICAERTALLKAVSEGCREDFLAIAIAGRGEDYCWPCGSCRQMLYEFAPDLRVLCARGDGAFVETKLSQLLPHGFGPKSLK